MVGLHLSELAEVEAAAETFYNSFNQNQPVEVLMRGFIIARYLPLFTPCFGADDWTINADYCQTWPGHASRLAHLT